MANRLQRPRAGFLLSPNSPLGYLISFVLSSAAAAPSLVFPALTITEANYNLA